MKTRVKILVILLCVFGLTACAAVLLGGGAAGGYWFGDNYQVQKK